MAGITGDCLVIFGARRDDAGLGRRWAGRCCGCGLGRASGRTRRRSAGNGDAVVVIEVELTAITFDRGVPGLELGDREGAEFV